MDKTIPFQKNKKKSLSGVKPGVVFIFLLFILFSTQGCVVNQLKEKMKPKVEQDNEIEKQLMEKRITFLEKKLDKIYNRLSIIQFMVDNHELMLKTSAPSTPQAMPQVNGAEKLSAGIPRSKSNLIEKESPLEEPQTPGFQEGDLTPEQLYSSGIRLINEKNFNSAINTFNKFLTKYPNHKLADNSLYWKAECYYSQKNFSEALKTFELVTTNYPDGSKYPDALLKAGYSYIGLGNKEMAKSTLQKVIKLFPFSNAAPKAEAKLKELL